MSARKRLRRVRAASIACVLANGLLGAVTGCTTAPAPIAPGLYQVSRDGGWGSGASMTPKLYAEAEAFCRARGQQALPVRTNEHDAQYGYGGGASWGGSSMQFRCVP